MIIHRQPDGDLVLHGSHETVRVGFYHYGCGDYEFTVSNEDGTVSAVFTHWPTFTEQLVGWIGRNR